MNSITIDKVCIRWLGHAGFFVEGQDIKIYIDPFQINDEPSFDDKADILLITHEHFDHCSPEDIRKVRRSDSIILIPESCSLEFRGDVRRIAEGDILAEGLEIKGIRVEVLPAYNLNKPYHPRGFGVGYVVELGKTRIYHAGDCDFFPEMKSVRADVGSHRGNLYYGRGRSCQCSRSYIPKGCNSNAYGRLEGINGNPEKFKTLVQGKNPEINVMILDS